MKFVNRKLNFISLPVFALVIFSLASCGGADAQSTEEESSRARSQSPGESTPTEIPQEINTSGADFQEAPLPENFPEHFPIPEGARIGSSVDLVGARSFRIYFSVTTTLDKILSFFRQELPAWGWTINGEGLTSLGTEVSFTDPVYDGLLVFTPVEMGVLIDLALYPSGMGERIPGSGDGSVASTELGETGGDFPADFPLPIGAEPITVPDKLKSEGYQQIFSYPNLPEMAYIQLTSAIVAKGWEIGDFNVDPDTHVYIMSFSDPASGFQGYALLTDDPGMIGMDLAGGSIIALHPGVP